MTASRSSRSIPRATTSLQTSTWVAPRARAASSFLLLPVTWLCSSPTSASASLCTVSLLWVNTSTLASCMLVTSWCTASGLSAAATTAYSWARELGRLWAGSAAREGAGTTQRYSFGSNRFSCSSCSGSWLSVASAEEWRGFRWLQL